VNRDSFAFSVLAGVVLGVATGAFLASMASIVGMVLEIWNSFDGGRPDVFGWMIVPVSAGILFGGAVGGAIGLMRARRKERRSAARSDVPARPDIP
jgi:MFS family permease